MTDPDIVVRLRESDGGYFMRQMFTEAADEIERLREELTASHESHGNEVGALTERLSLAIHERDEARREVCRDEACRPSPSPPCTANQVAARRGWDCFKEER